MIQIGKWQQSTVISERADTRKIHCAALDTLNFS